MRISQILVRDPDGSPLLVGNEVAVSLARGITFAACDERLDFSRQLRISRQRRQRCGSAGGCGGDPPRRRSIHGIRLDWAVVYRASNYTGICGNSAPWYDAFFVFWAFLPRRVPK
jgi:hypothetical protein